MFSIIDAVFQSQRYEFVDKDLIFENEFDLICKLSKDLIKNYEPSNLVVKLNNLHFIIARYSLYFEEQLNFHLCQWFQHQKDLLTSVGVNRSEFWAHQTLSAYHWAHE